MALPALKSAVEELTILPPTFRLSEAFRLVENMQDLEHVVAEGDANISRWRAETRASARRNFEKVRVASAGLPKAVAAQVLLPMVDQLAGTAGRLSEEFETPFDQTEKFQPLMLKLGRLGGPAARYMRRQIKRIDDIREKLRSTYEDIYFEALAFRAEFDPDAEPTGEVLSSSEDVSGYFEKLLAK